MSAGKTFDLVVDAYRNASGQTAAKAKVEVAEKLATAWALAAFGPSVARRVGDPVKEPANPEPTPKPKGKGKKGGSK